MSVFCIPRHLVEDLKSAAIKGKINIKEIANMSSAERRAFFAEKTNPELGKFINTEFEKAIAAKSQKALLDWAKSVFDPKAREAKQYNSVLSKIRAMSDEGLLSPANEKSFLQDLIAEKLGVTVSAEEVAKLEELSKKVDEAAIPLIEDFGSPDKAKETLVYFEARKKIDDYILEVNPANRLKILTSTIGRGSMLLSPKSALLNVLSNAFVGSTEALTRRLANLKLTSADPDLAKKYKKMVREVYKKTGYDMSRMTSLDDSGPSGERLLGDVTHSQGKGAIRKIGRFYEDIVFKRLLGAPDSAFAAAAFADSVGLASKRIAKGDKALASKYMADSMLLNPKTAQGAMLRAQGVLDAQVATWTNESWASALGLDLRKAINNVTGDLRGGDLLTPFVKTPANVIATGLDYAGAGAVKAVIDVGKAFQNGTKVDMQNVARNAVRSGIGMVAAALIASLLKDDDFVGAYDAKRKQIEQLRNSKENSIRVGDKWVSIDYLGPLAMPVAAMMFARQKSDNGPKKVLSYALSQAAKVGEIPGASTVGDLDKTITDLVAENPDWATLGSKSMDAAMEFAASRLIPSIVSDVAKATDQEERQTGRDALSKVKAKIPVLRKSLPAKKNILNESMGAVTDKEKIAAPIIDLLAGARIKLDRETPLIKELSDIQRESGKSLNFTDWDTTTSKKIQLFKQKFSSPGQIDEAKTRYGFWIKKGLEELTATQKYKDMDAEEKTAAINNLDSEAIEKVFKQFNFKYQTLPKKK